MSSAIVVYGFKGWQNFCRSCLSLGYGRGEAVSGTYVFSHFGKMGFLQREVQGFEFDSYLPLTVPHRGFSLGSTPGENLSRMTYDSSSGDTIYNGEENREEQDGEAGDAPIFANSNIGVAAWANEDKNGNYYLTVQVPLLDRFQLFVPDEYKSAFNQFVEHVKE